MLMWVSTAVSDRARAADSTQSWESLTGEQGLKGVLEECGENGEAEGSTLKPIGS